MEAVESVCDKYQQELSGTYFKLKRMLPSERVFLEGKQKDGVSRPEMIPKESKAEFHKNSKIYSHWPFGRAIFANKDKTFVIKVGIVDHLEVSVHQQ